MKHTTTKNMGWYMTVVFCMHAVRKLMCTNISVFWGTKVSAKVYNIVMFFIGSN